MKFQNDPIDTSVGIRGPELHQPEAIAAVVAGQSLQALQRYAAGMLALIQVWRLLAMARQCEHMRTERAFLLSQLATLEARDPRAVEAALANRRPGPMPSIADSGSDELATLVAALSDVISAGSCEEATHEKRV